MQVTTSQCVERVDIITLGQLAPTLMNTTTDQEVKHILLTIERNLDIQVEHRERKETGKLQHGKNPTYLQDSDP